MLLLFYAAPPIDFHEPMQAIELQPVDEEDDEITLLAYYAYYE